MLDETTRRGFVGGTAAAAIGLALPRHLGAATASRAPQVSPEARLRELGIELPSTPRPVATYVPAVTVGNVLYVAGHTPRLPDTSPGFQGKVGADFTVDDGRAAARQVGLNVLATIRGHLGSLDRVSRLIRTFGMVNCAPDFGQQPQVINGFSDFIVEIFGEEAGKGTRAAVGMSSLPSGMAVEIETYWEIRT
ncbi:MAG: RidA family protein [Gemmatimonadota bacterium]|nr:RidA family protein [Gemmatimonadota bacterium]